MIPLCSNCHVSKRDVENRLAEHGCQARIRPGGTKSKINLHSFVEYDPLLGPAPQGDQPHLALLMPHDSGTYLGRSQLH